MSEQLGSFLPSETDKLEHFRQPKEQKLIPLTGTEKIELSRLTAAEKQREIDLNIFAPALDNVETLLLPAPKRMQLQETKNTHEIKKDEQAMRNNIESALTRELKLAELSLMEVGEKNKKMARLEKILAMTHKETFGDLVSRDDLKFLKEILGARFDHLFTEQNRKGELALRSTADIKKKFNMN